MCVYTRGKLIIMLNFQLLKHVNYPLIVQFRLLHGPPTHKNQQCLFVFGPWFFAELLGASLLSFILGLFIHKQHNTENIKSLIF